MGGVGKLGIGDNIMYFAIHEHIRCNFFCGEIFWSAHKSYIIYCTVFKQYASVLGLIYNCFFKVIDIMMMIVITFICTILEV